MLKIWDAGCAVSKRKLIAIITKSMSKFMLSWCFKHSSRTTATTYFMSGANSSAVAQESWPLIIVVYPDPWRRLRPRPPVTSSETFYWPHASDQRTSDSGNKQCRPSERGSMGIGSSAVSGATGWGYPEHEVTAILFASFVQIWWDF